MPERPQRLMPHVKKPSQGPNPKPTLPFNLDQYHTHRSAVAIIMGNFFLRYLNLLYQEFDGDLLLPLVLGEIAHHNILRFYSSNAKGIEVYETVATSQNWTKHLEPINAFSISYSTGIPRETIRRKIEKLQKKGWIVKSDRGDLFISETVMEYFSKDFNKKILTELFEACDCLRKTLKTTMKTETEG